MKSLNQKTWRAIKENTPRKRRVPIARKNLVYTDYISGIERGETRNPLLKMSKE